MSRKSRRRRHCRNLSPAPVQRAAEPEARHIDPEEQVRILKGLGGCAMDGYSNAAAFLGEDSPLMAAGTFLRSGLSSNTQLLTTTYRECWLATRIIDTPAEDMTRNWYTLTGNFDADDLADLRRTEARNSIQQEITDAIRWARLYGGALALIVIDGEGDRLEEKLDLGRLQQDCFRGLLVLDRFISGYSFSCAL